MRNYDDWWITEITLIAYSHLWPPRLYPASSYMRIGYPHVCDRVFSLYVLRLGPANIRFPARLHQKYLLLPSFRTLALDTWLLASISHLETCLIERYTAFAYLLSWWVSARFRIVWDCAWVCAVLPWRIFWADHAETRWWRGMRLWVYSFGSSFSCLRRIGFVCRI